MDQREARPLRILIVEDSPADVALFNTFFSGDSRCEFLVAKDGEEALGRLETGIHGGEGVPDLMVLDINLPRIDGKEVLREVKSHPKLRSIPVVILTSSEKEEDIRESYEQGASCVLIKPCDVAGVRLMFRALEMFWVNCVRYADRRQIRGG